MNRSAGLPWALFLLSACVACASGGGRPQDDPSLSRLYQKVTPAVGTIYTYALEEPESPDERGQKAQEEALGSGVLISDTGEMVTAAHVVQTADVVVVQFIGGDKVMARVVASDPSADLALLHLNDRPASGKAVPLGDSDRVFVGDPVFVIGAPYGIRHVLTQGCVSARHRPNVLIKNFELAEFFQTDTVINQGNSGGPMFNMKGEVIGIVSSILTRSGGSEGIGFAVTSNTARKILLEKPTPWSGVKGILISDDLAQAFNLPQPSGLLVERVARGSFAHEGKLRGGTLQADIEGEEILLGGDIVLSVLGIRIETDLEVLGRIKKALAEVPLGGTIRVTVLRGGKEVELSTKRKY